MYLLMISLSFSTTDKRMVFSFWILSIRLLIISGMLISSLYQIVGFWRAYSLKCSSMLSMYFSRSCEVYRCSLSSLYALLVSGLVICLRLRTSLALILLSSSCSSLHLQGGISYDFYFLINSIIIIGAREIAEMMLALIAIGIVLVSSIEVQLVKRNVYIPKNAHLLTNVELQKKNVELIPTSITLQTIVTNHIPKFADYFDFFYYLSPSDLLCYQNVIANEQYLFPCPFLTDRNSKTSIGQASSKKITKTLQNSDANTPFINIIDNTLFPYPDGAYSYSGINIDIVTNLEIAISESYEYLGRRLIFINVTFLSIFLVILFAIIFKTNKLNKQMNLGKGQSSHEKHPSYLMEIDEENESSFVTEMMKSEEEVMLTESLMSKRDSAKVKSGLIQFLGSRVDQEEEEYG